MTIIKGNSGPSFSADLTNPNSINQAALGTNATFNRGSSNPIITVVRDPKHPLGKHFALNSDRAVSKKSAVNLSFGIAMMHRVETHEELAVLLAKVGDDPNAAIINTSFDGIEIGEEFAILSEREIESRLGIPASDRERQRGVHQIEYDGKTLKAVGRFKENVRPSNWQLLDRDIDGHTPTKFSSLNISEWISALEPILPGISKASYVQTPSTSSRVIMDGKPVGGENGHVWVFVNNPDDVERARTGIIVRAAQAEMAWTKPRYSRKEEGNVVGKSLATIIDQSVWTAGRLVFDGQPTVGEGLTVVPLLAVVHQGEHNMLDTSAIVLPEAKVIREITRKAGVEMIVSASGSGLRTTSNDLILATEIETKDHGILTVREIIERGITGKIRCQTPFRESDSYAAFYSINPNGIPFVYDSGTSTTHWLNEFERDTVKIVKANSVVGKLVTAVKDDSAAILEDEAVEALAVIKLATPSEYQRKRAALKQANPDVSLTALDGAVKSWTMAANTAQTHHGYATSLLADQTEGEWTPVGHSGALFVLDPDMGLWERKAPEKLVCRVAELSDGKENCQRSSDYRAIVEHAISLASDEKFFADAPVGIACQGDFYQIVGDGFTKVKLTPEHRQRVMLDFKPEKMPTPLFDAFLHETFESKNEDEEAQQRSLIQEIRETLNKSRAANMRMV